MSINPGSPTETDANVTMNYEAQGEALSMFRNNLEEERQNRHPIITLPGIATTLTAVTIFAIGTLPSPVLAQVPSGEAGRGEIPVHNPKPKASNTTNEESVITLYKLGASGQAIVTEEELQKSYVGNLYEFASTTPRSPNTGIFRKDGAELYATGRDGCIWVTHLPDGRVLVEKTDIQLYTLFEKIPSYDETSKALDMTSTMTALKVVQLNDAYGTILMYSQNPYSINGHKVGLSDLGIWFSVDGGKTWIYYGPMSEEEIEALKR